MVPGRIARKRIVGKFLISAAASLAAVVLLAWPGDAVPVNDPGPFFPLKVGHKGIAYADRLPSGASYTRIAGRLASGLSVSTSGRISGQPAETGTFSATFEARESSGVRYPVRVALTVFEANERDMSRASPSFGSAGPYGTDVESLRVDLTSTFDQHRFRTRVRLVRPVGAAGPRPLLLFHRGRGFDEDSYQRLHERIASWGIAVASVEDAYSFSGSSFSAGNTQYDVWRAELGMLSASGVVEALADYLLDRSGDPGDRLAGSFDGDNMFFAGHSRGGGAAHASHQRSFELRLKGLIYLMAFDLRYFDEVKPPASAPAYPIFTDHARTPSLIIAAENDGDLSYPIADQLIDRATGPTTQVTLYGGVHNLISDSHPAEGNARITRTEERTRVADWIVCFVKRWAELDADLDWRLYGGAHQGSQTVGVTSWRPSARTLPLEDAQDNDLDRNLRGRNLVASLRRRERSMYPASGDLTSLGLKHTFLTPTATVSAWRMASDRALDVSGHARIVMRVAQTSSRGWSRTGMWLRLVDRAGGASWFRVWEPSAGGLLPEYNGLSPLDRFVDVHVDLADFFGSSSAPAADKSNLYGLDLFLVARGGGVTGESVVVDAVRFE